MPSFCTLMIVNWHIRFLKRCELKFNAFINRIRVTAASEPRQNKRGSITFNSVHNDFQVQIRRLRQCKQSVSFCLASVLISTTFFELTIRREIALLLNLVVCFQQLRWLRSRGVYACGVECSSNTTSEQLANEIGFPRQVSLHDRNEGEIFPCFPTFELLCQLKNEKHLRTCFITGRY